MLYHSSTHSQRLLSLPVLALLIFTSLAISTGHAEPEQASESGVNTTLSNQKKAEIIDSVLYILDSCYIFPEVAVKMQEHIRTKLEYNQYDEITDLYRFTEQLTDDMYEISSDRHLRISVMSPQDFDPSEGDTLTYDKIETRAIKNFGFRKVECLPGNVGYLDLRMFDNPKYGGPTAAAAMNFLANSDAVIIDIRNNGGGEGYMVQFLCSYFFKEPVRLNSFYDRANDETMQSWTNAFVPGKTMYDTDLYVLISDNTGSAAEGFAYNMKARERATLVGSTTRGAAHTVGFYDFPNLQVRAKISTGRPINPVTGDNWEVVGIKADIEVPSEHAFDKAYLMALEKISGWAEDEARRYELDWAMAGVNAKLNPITLEGDLLKSYAGTYGSTTILYENGALIYVGTKGTRYALIPLTSNLFQFSDTDAARVRFMVDESGKVAEIKMLYDDGYIIRKTRIE
ncbi:MAG: S41 family peptidase [Candidatus Zixiibacteriota bacterium]|nr:MAG: S41 family peptidase [candidate division Zixibacteria bacterium]